MKDEITREDQIIELQNKRTKHLENVQVFQGQLAELKKSKAADDEIKSKQVNDVLESLPDTSAKGLIDKVLKLKTGESAQLVENIEKLRLAAMNEQRKAGVCELEIRNLEKDIKETRRNEQAKHAADKVTELIELHKKSEAFLHDELIPAVFSCEEGWGQRLPGLGFPRTYEIIAVSFLQPGKLGSLSVQGLIESIQNLRGYGPPLIEKNKNLQSVRPLVRDTYFGYEKP